MFPQIKNLYFSVELGCSVSLILEDKTRKFYALELTNLFQKNKLLLSVFICLSRVICDKQILYFNFKKNLERNCFV